MTQLLAPILHVASELVGDVHVVTADGELDMASAPQLETEIDACLSGGSATIVLDLTGLTFIDSAGLALMVRTDRRLFERNRYFGIVAWDEDLRQALSYAGVDQAMPLFHSVESALDNVA
ncbi:MAG: anti-sigma factor antagonist [Solirubrobacteraceae bacterium]|nr:anti-sigma factor antagonist [Solirubrobacteraceae bacterium]